LEIGQIWNFNFRRRVNEIGTISKSSDYIQDKIKQEKVKEYERQIDAMVYELYGLMEEEREVVEEKL